uniref:Uncharacterized protein n=1 Tax=Cucumis melo TaxID=3656 RepID=A0A9I9DZJ0_CUCME
MENKVSRELAPSHVRRKPHPQVLKSPEKHRTAISEVEEVKKLNLMKTKKDSTRPKLSPNKKSKVVEKTSSRRTEKGMDN